MTLQEKHIELITETIKYFFLPIIAITVPILIYNIVKLGELMN